MRFHQTEAYASMERGAALVETAVVAMVLLLVSFGIIEYGLLFGQADDVAGLIRTGARTGSATGTGPVSDADIIASMESSGTRLGKGIDKIVIFKAVSPGGQVPAACLTGGSVSDTCNVYTPVDWGLSSAALSARPEANGWPAAARKPGVDYIGVYVLATHSFMTNFYGKTKDFTDTAVMRLENSGGADGAGPETTAGLSNGSALDPGWDTGRIVPWVSENTGPGHGGNGGGGF